MNQQNLDASSAEELSKYRSASKRILFNAYKEYTEKASMIDESGSVTEESIWDFKYLFESSAKVLNDISISDSGPQLIDVQLYADLVSTYMSRKGLVVEFDKPNINDFFAGAQEQYNARVDNADEDDNIFFYSYKTIKKQYNILNKNNQVLYYNEPMIYPIEITFRISIKNQKADIVSILPTN